MGNASRASNKIWRTVVVAGAMLGTPLAASGCKKKPAVTKPTDPPKTDPGSGSDAGSGSSAERPRTPEDERPIGRGFVLA
jgi:hypothetical protein